jgi:diguanylate cyclase (GGDEF)-like protein
VLLGTPQRVNRFRSLPARISLFVFCATLVTSLFVTGVSVRSIDTFLRGKIALKFPEIAQEANRNLNHWYDEQFRNLGVLAASDVLRTNVPKLEPGKALGSGGEAAADIAEYLAYVLARFDHFDALFILSPEGETLAWVGDAVALPEQVKITALSLRHGAMPQLLVIDGDYLQAVSVRIENNQGKSVGLLNAIMPLAAVAETLRTQHIGETGEILLVGANGLYVAVGKETIEMGALHEALPAIAAPGSVVDYQNVAGNRVVGYATTLSQYGLTLAIEERYSEAFAPLLSAFRSVLSINLGVVLLFGLAAYRVAVSIARPIEALSDAARRISEDEDDVVIPQNDAADEVGVLTRTFSQMTARLASKAEALERSQSETEQAVQKMRDQNAELQRVNEVLEQLSITDGLTKLHNHRYFQEELAKEVKRADRTNDPLALVLIDIDHFKKWNDHLGHAGGDEILRKIAYVMNEVVRETDILARYGGEEFAVILPKTGVEGALMLAEKLRSSIADGSIVVDLPKQSDPLTVSVGVNLYSGDAKALFTGADQALYRAKDGGRDCVMAAEGLV